MNETTKDRIQKQALRYANKYDREGFTTFLDALDVPAQRDAMEAVFLTDDVEKVQQVLHPSALGYWGNSHAMTHSDLAPKVFDAWAAVEPLAFGIVSRSLQQTLNDAGMQTVLRGEGKTWAAKYFHRTLAGAPNTWLELDLRWIGPMHSPWRAMAEKLGWNERMLLPMLGIVQTSFEKLEALIGSVPNPYSVACTIRYLEEQKEKQGQERDMLALWLDSTCAADASVQRYCPQADAYDVALARIIGAGQGLMTKRFHVNPGGEPVPPQDHLRLQQLWDTHVALDCVPLFLEQLVYGQLDLRKGATTELVLLPNLEAVP